MRMEVYGYIQLSHWGMKAHAFPGAWAINPRKWAPLFLASAQKHAILHAPLEMRQPKPDLRLGRLRVARTSETGRAWC